MSYNDNPNRLYKNPERGRLTGVCAGVADYFSISVTAVRIFLILAVIFGGFPFFIAYVVLWMILDTRPENLYDSPVEERFWKSYRRSPAEMNDTLSDRFAGINQRIADMEKIVTSRSYSLRRKIDEL